MTDLSDSSNSDATMEREVRGVHGPHGGAQDPPAHLAHHFESTSQQYDTNKLGMWVFLCTEILMFGGLFCAYAVYRATHPEVFEYAHHYLDTMLGATNTVVLLASSLTMAWGVRCAQLGQRMGLIICLALTLLGGFTFMGIKAVEYGKKIQTNKWVGAANKYHPAYTGVNEESAGEKGTETDEHDTSAGQGESASKSTAATESADLWREPESTESRPTPEESMIAEPAVGPPGLSSRYAVHDYEEAATHGDDGEVHDYSFELLSKSEQRRVHLFFQIYYLMTGLHGLHVLIGMGLITWLLVRAMNGVFTPRYYAPVDIVGLYWHLVDLIWIFLFPLLYLIH